MEHLMNGAVEDSGTESLGGVVLPEETAEAMRALPPPKPAPPPSATAAGARWSTKEEGALRDLLATKGVPHRPDAAFWREVAEEFAAVGEMLGFGSRTHEAVQHKALALGLYSSTRSGRDKAQPRGWSDRPTGEIQAAPRQGSFGALESKLQIADVLERIARELRGEVR